jgi:CheY-like chemotaxis protein
LAPRNICYAVPRRGGEEGDLVATILIIEDNEANRDILLRYLLLKGHQPQVAVDGSEGVLLAEQLLPDLILLDLSLPMLDGWEAAQHLKRSAKTQAIPIIAVTAHAMIDDRERALAAGCDDYETKPIDLALLLRKIELHLGRAREQAPGRPQGS